MDTSDLADSGSSSTLERRIVLAGEEELEGPCASPHHSSAAIDAFSAAVKSQFAHIFSVHVYSLAAKRVKVGLNLPVKPSCIPKQETSGCRAPHGV